MKRDPHGFSLIELLVVIAILLIIAAIAIPSLLRSRIAANQASAVASLRTLVTAQYTYAASYNIGYSSALSYLGPSTAAIPTSTAAALVDSVLSGGTKSGYTFSYTPSGDPTSGRVEAYSFSADPLNPGFTGASHYYTDQSGVIRQNSTAAASATDPPVGG